MIRIENHLGVIEIANSYFEILVGQAASSCFGVAGMAASGPAQGFKSFITKRESPSKGVRVCSISGKLEIDLHIIVTFGVNIAAIVKSIVNKVRYTVEEATGLQVGKVNVYVDGMKAE
ncbi:MAG: Asp23/Gls24 family envelope stress response protein [Oscillospiraceae bacterium]